MKIIEGLIINRNEAKVQTSRYTDSEILIDYTEVIEGIKNVKSEISILSSDELDNQLEIMDIDIDIPNNSMTFYISFSSLSFYSLIYFDEEYIYYPPDLTTNFNFQYPWRLGSGIERLLGTILECNLGYLFEIFQSAA